MGESKEGGIRSIHQRELNYLSEFLVDVNQIGQLLGKGMGHWVYEYGSDQVIKIPIDRGWHRPGRAEEREQDLTIIKQYFPDQYLETEVIRSEKNPYYCLIQRKLNDFSNISPENVAAVANEFHEMLKINRHLVSQQGMSLDFLGKEGMTRCVQALAGMDGVKPEISNIVIEHSSEGKSNLVIPDFSILRFGTEHYLGSREIIKEALQGFRTRKISNVTFDLNKTLIKWLFNVSIG